MEIFKINVGDTDYVVKYNHGSYYIFEDLVQLTILNFTSNKWLSSVPTMSPNLTNKLGEAVKKHML
jgi:hypothetical protein